jgi:hypothetical protein
VAGCVGRSSVGGSHSFQQHFAEAILQLLKAIQVLWQALFRARFSAAAALTAKLHEHRYSALTGLLPTL